MKFTRAKGLKAFRILWWLSLTGGFLFEITGQFKKYFAGDTTTVVHNRKADVLGFPIFTVCPKFGFNYTHLNESGLGPDYWVFKKNGSILWDFNQTPEEWLDLHRKSTFAFEDLGLELMYIKDGLVNKSYDITEQDNKYLTVIRVNTNGRGSCYTMEFKDPVTNAADALWLNFRNFPEAGNQIVVFAHESILESYLFIMNYWVNQPFSASLEQNYVYNFELFRRHIIRSNRKRDCEPTSTLAKLHSCIIKEIIRKCIMCRFPYVQNYLDHNLFLPLMNYTSQDQLRGCHNKSEVLTQNLCIWKTVVNHETFCSEPCDTWVYNIAKRGTNQPGTPQPNSGIYIYFQHVEIAEESEYVLVDNTAMVAAVGGSSGLILGFSFMECGMKLIKLLELLIDKMKARKKIETKHHLVKRVAVKEMCK